MDNLKESFFIDSLQLHRLGALSIEYLDMSSKQNVVEVYVGVHEENISECRCSKQTFLLLHSNSLKPSFLKLHVDNSHEPSVSQRAYRQIAKLKFPEEQTRKKGIKKRFL